MTLDTQCTLWDFRANEQMFFSGQAALDFIYNPGPFEVQVFGAATWDDPSFVWTKDDLFDCTRSPGDKIE
jgi:hypothetical protein